MLSRNLNLKKKKATKNVINKLTNKKSKVKPFEIVITKINSLK